MSRGLLNGLDYSELMYADDTALITNNANAMNRLIKSIETHAAYYGLNFNKSKCVAMVFNSYQKIQFGDGTRMPTPENAVYLGAGVNKTCDPTHEVHSKMGQCFALLNKLHHFFRHSNCPVKFKLTTFDAVIRSKLVYGLEMVHLPQHLLSKLNALQLKGLRKILHMDTTFVNRENSNKRVFEVANLIKSPKNTPNKNILPFGTYVNNKQAEALKHTIRANNKDPLRQAALIPDTPFIAGIDHRRVGRPRGKWVIKTCEYIWSAGTRPFGTKQQWKIGKAHV